jgi:hypothetical protein
VVQQQQDERRVSITSSTMAGSDDKSSTANMILADDASASGGPIRRIGLESRTATGRAPEEGDTLDMAYFLKTTGPVSSHAEERKVRRKIVLGGMFGKRRGEEGTSVQLDG